MTLTTPNRPESNVATLKKRSRSYSTTSHASSTAVTPARSTMSTNHNSKSVTTSTTNVTNTNNTNNTTNKQETPKTKKAKNGKAQPAGLRLFSMRVCEQVKAKRITTYREVADEVVKAEHARLQETGQRPKGVLDEKKKKDDDKNIRRRIYDALNVLIAMEIVTKDPKEKIIRWKGFPSMNYSDSAKLLQEKEELLSRIQEKKEALQDLLVQNVCFRNLTLRNEETHGGGINTNCNMMTSHHPDHAASTNGAKDVPDIQKEGGGSGSGIGDIGGDQEVGGKIPLPFIVVNTSQRAQINCEMNEDRTDVKFDFDMPFEIFNDSHILENLGLNKISHRDLSTMYPPDVLNYCIHNNLLGRILTDQPLGPGDARPSSYPPPPHHHNPHSSNVSSASAASTGTYPPHHPSHRSHHPSHHPNHPPPPYVTSTSHSHPVPPPGGVYSHSSGGGPSPPPSSSSPHRQQQQQQQQQPPPSSHSRTPRGGQQSGQSEGSSNRQMYSNSGLPNENFPLW